MRLRKKNKNLVMNFNGMIWKFDPVKLEVKRTYRPACYSTIVIKADNVKEMIKKLNWKLEDYEDKLTVDDYLEEEFFTKCLLKIEGQKSNMRYHH